VGLTLAAFGGGAVAAGVVGAGAGVVGAEGPEVGAGPCPKASSPKLLQDKSCWGACWEGAPAGVGLVPADAATTVVGDVGSGGGAAGDAARGPLLKAWSSKPLCGVGVVGGRGGVWGLLLWERGAGGVGVAVEGGTA